MRQFFSWQIRFAVVLVLLSVFFYFTHYVIFHDMHHIFIYLLGDIAFLFLDVLIVMLVLHRLLEIREKKSMFQKLNMVIGTFFSEVGTDLMKKCSCFDATLGSISPDLLVRSDWSEKDFAIANRKCQNYDSVIKISESKLSDLKGFLMTKRMFLLNLLQNPNLLEHEAFTDLLWAVFHLTDELGHRNDVKKLSPRDHEHLSGDIKRAYKRLMLRWLDYLKHLKRDYPYLFSLALRVNPFDIEAQAEVL